MAVDEGFDDNAETTEESEVKKIYQAILDAVPTGVCIVNIIVALNMLSLEFASELCNCDDEEDDDVSPVGNLPGTPFGSN